MYTYTQYSHTINVVAIKVEIDGLMARFSPKIVRSFLLGIYCLTSTCCIDGVYARPQWRSTQEASILTSQNYTQVPLVPFHISIEFKTLSSPDLLYYGLTEYLLNRTSARSLELLCHDSAETFAHPINFLYNGSAVVSTEYGRMSQVLLQNEQRMALTDPNLETVLQEYYESAIAPYKGNIYVRGIEMKETIPDNDTGSVIPPQEFSEAVQGVAWYTIVIASAGGAAGCATLMVILSIGVVTYRQYWKDQLQIWKYNVDRERDLRMLVTDDDGPEDEMEVGYDRRRMILNTVDTGKFPATPSPPNYRYSAQGAVVAATNDESRNDD